jgi:hypothetical protein
VEDEEDGLVILGAKLLADEGLVLAEELGVELDVAWLINTVDVYCGPLAKERRKEHIFPRSKGYEYLLPNPAAMLKYGLSLLSLS